jgi:hypothetical protein
MRRPGHGPARRRRLPPARHASSRQLVCGPRTPARPDGRRRRIRRGGYPTRQIARQALAQLSTPGPAGGTAITTGQWLGRWLACRTSPATSTVRGYAAHVRLYLAPHLGAIPLAELTSAHVQAMFTAIIRQHQATGHPVTPATLARIRATCAPRSIPRSATA